MGNGVRVSRRRFLRGATAGVLLTAGGASAAVVMRERGGEARTAVLRPGAPSVATPAPAATAPSTALRDPDVRLRHLLRRTTFVALPADVRHFSGQPLDSVVDQLLGQAAADDTLTESALAGLGLDLTKPADIVSWWLARMVLTPRPMLERMTLFWHGLLTSGIAKTGARRASLLLDQNRLFRAHAFDTLDVLLKSVVRDPAMMLWLDLATSKVGHANENYARELMEMFTLGAGNYSEQDVRESARAHTGYALSARGTQFVFRPAQHDNGPKTFLGQTGNLDADAIVDIILKQPVAAEHFARKVFESFAYAAPGAATLAPIAAVARSSGFSLRAVMRAVLTSDAFYAPQAYRAQVKSPTEYVVGAARLLGVQGNGRGLAQASRLMGQVLFNPPDVSGWPGGRTWIGTSTWFARVNFAAALVNGGGRARARTAQAPNVASLFASPASAQEAVGQAALATVDGQLSAPSRAALAAYLDDGAGFATLAADQRDARLRGLVALLLSSPEYQLA
ncbi:MAG: DUF1800 domain-containing protein [Dehalococcoidia bacterium]|nr:DUF1800 domain-containing protein [Dehalococcoidia bacterium]